MRRVLFVDDEPNVLEGLESTLKPMRAQWEMTFARGGERALTVLDGKSFDVLVTDFDMPGIDGATLLKRASVAHPEMVRVILSGANEEDVARRVAHTAHQFLGKPCVAAVIFEMVERTCALHHLLSDPWLKQAIGRVGQLPVLPEIYHDVMRTLEDKGRSLADVGVVVARDAVLSAKILQMVNSAFFGLSQPMTKIEHAVRYLGADVIKCLVLMVDVFGEGQLGPVLSSSLNELHRHSLATARIARVLVPEKRQGETAFIAAMLHDIGKIVLASRMPDRFARVLTAAVETGRPMYQVEQDRGGVTHAEIGAYILAQWGLPYAIIEAVAHHHAPTRVTQSRFDVLGAVYLANLLAHEQDPPHPQQPGAGHDPVDLAYLRKLDVEPRLGNWRARAAEAVSQSAEA